MEVTQADITKMTDFLGEIHDPRRHQGNFRHNLIDILVIGLSTVISGEDEYEAMEELGLARESWFKTFLELPNGIPDECTFERVFRRVNPKELMKSMYGWLNLVSQCGNRNVNRDGKTIRGSADGVVYEVYAIMPFMWFQRGLERKT